LLESEDAATIECLCALMTTAGKILDHSGDGQNMVDYYFKRMKETMDKVGEKHKQGGYFLMVMLRDTITLRKAEGKWRHRNAEGATTIPEARTLTNKDVADTVLGCKFDADVVFSAVDADGVQLDPFRMEGSELLWALDRFGEGATSLWGGRYTVTTTLDPSQCKAILAALTRRVSIIQGPPGPFSPRGPRLVA